MNQPLPAVHAAEQIATTAVLLASDAATMINRAKMLVDGGCGVLPTVWRSVMLQLGEPRQAALVVPHRRLRPY